MVNSSNLNMYSLEEINSNPIFQPPSWMLFDINEVILNINFKKETERIKKIYKWKKGDYFLEDIKGSKVQETNKKSFLYCNFDSGKWTINKEIKKFNKAFHKYDNVYFNRGIEILGITPSKKTKDGKFKYDMISIKDMKKYLKMNNVKKISKMSKLELVKALIKL